LVLILPHKSTTQHFVFNFWFLHYFTLYDKKENVEILFIYIQLNLSLILCKYQVIFLGFGCCCCHCVRTSFRSLGHQCIICWRSDSDFL